MDAWLLFLWATPERGARRRGQGKRFDPAYRSSRHVATKAKKQKRKAGQASKRRNRRRK